MLEGQLDILSFPAARAREHLVELEAERRLAEATGVATIGSYMEDLDWELEAWRRVYVTSAVTEIAVLRAELGARLTDE